MDPINLVYILIAVVMVAVVLWVRRERLRTKAAADKAAAAEKAAERKRKARCAHDSISLVDTFDGSMYEPWKEAGAYVCDRCHAVVEEPKRGEKMLSEYIADYEHAVRYYNDLMVQAQERLEAALAQHAIDLEAKDKELAEQSRIISDLHAALYVRDHPEV